MWRTTSKPLFIFSLLSFLSAPPSFSFSMQLEKALSSEREKESERREMVRKKIEIERWWWRWDDYMWAGLNDFSPSDSSLLIISPTACRHLWRLYHWKSSLQREEESCTLPDNRWRLALLALKAQLQQLRVILWGWFLSFVVKMICSSLSEAVFICNPKCAANFLPNRYGTTAAHALMVQITKLQFNSALIIYHIKANNVLR